MPVSGSSRCAGPATGGVAGALEGVVDAAVGLGDEVLDDVTSDLLRVDEMRDAELAGSLRILSTAISGSIVKF
ncbi:hypothetical protein CWO91_25195 [Bradyrhizobium genosp. SA-3]|nr:hypothetical protein CWO91_25195 [Bradyrhizobium genosp. SA-3]